MLAKSLMNLLADLLLNLLAKSLVRDVSSTVDNRSYIFQELLRVIIFFKSY